MTNCSRFAALGAVVAALAVATPAAAAPLAATPKASARAQIVKPLTFAARQDLNFGTVVLGTLSANSSVTIGQTSTSVSACGANLTCSGPSQPALYRVTATPSQPLVVRSTASLLSLTGATGVAPTIAFTPAAPASVSVANAATFADFYVGGSIVVTPTTPEGVYVGDMDVTVDYN
jgi:Domain of unknown function (DUF4402)